MTDLPALGLCPPRIISLNPLHLDLVPLARLEGRRSQQGALLGCVTHLVGPALGLGGLHLSAGKGARHEPGWQGMRLP